MDPLWKAQSSKPLSDAQAVDFLQEYMRKQSDKSAPSKNVSKDIEKLHNCLQAYSKAKQPSAR